VLMLLLIVLVGDIGLSVWVIYIKCIVFGMGGGGCWGGGILNLDVTRLLRNIAI
jgi:hypothetical protein